MFWKVLVLNEGRELWCFVVEMKYGNEINYLTITVNHIFL